MPNNLAENVSLEVHVNQTEELKGNLHYTMN